MSEVKALKKVYDDKVAEIENKTNTVERLEDLATVDKKLADDKAKEAAAKTAQASVSKKEAEAKNEYSAHLLRSNKLSDAAKQ